MPNIHPSAIVSADATLADDVTVGPFAIIDAGVQIGSGCRIEGQAWITGESRLGNNNTIGYGSIIGHAPQDTSFDTSIPSYVELGDHNCIREYVTLHRSTQCHQSTRIGNHNFIMTGSHMGHDSSLGDHNTIANNVLLAGHVQIGNHTFLGGGSGFHQFIHIGDYAMAQGNAAISQDIPPYCVAHNHNQLSGLNIIGLRRGGFDPATRTNIKQAYKLIFLSGSNRKQALEQAENQNWTPEARVLIDAARHPSRKGILTR